mgnify:FL=1|tara:strand:+ start:27249 stop:27497 length:249 start_codon:yes stop_codon:yes gene_type:complete
MKLEISKEKNPVQWALDMAGKTECPYAAMVLFTKRDEIIKQITVMEQQHKGYQSKDIKLQLSTFRSMARELERAAEIIIIGI